MTSPADGGREGIRGGRVGPPGRDSAGRLGVEFRAGATDADGGFAATSSWSSSSSRACTSLTAQRVSKPARSSCGGQGHQGGRRRDERGQLRARRHRDRDREATRSRDAPDCLVHCRSVLRHLDSARRMPVKPGRAGSSARIAWPRMGRLGQSMAPGPGSRAAATRKRPAERHHIPAARPVARTLLTDES